MLIRPPTAADLAPMARVEAEARAMAAAGWSPPAAGLRAVSVEALADGWRARLAEPGRAVRVAVVDTAVAGCVAWGAGEAEREAEVFGPFVDPVRWRRGVGRALVAVAMRRARLAGFERVALWLPAADPRARRFAARLGFAAGAPRRAVDGVAEIRYAAVLPAGLAFARPGRPGPGAE